MKTRVSFVTVKELDDYGQEERIDLRIRTESGEMMTNRVIQLFSQYSPERLSYDFKLEQDIVRGYMEKFFISYFMLSILHEKEIADDFISTLYGGDKNPGGIYGTFLQWAMEVVHKYVVDWIKHGSQTPIPKIVGSSFAKFFKDYEVSNSDIHALLTELLRARLRLKKFILRYTMAIDYVLSPCDGNCRH